MVSVFEEKMCDFCLKHKTPECKKNVIREKINSKSQTLYCPDYLKDKDKIIPYEKPLIVTAPRDYVNNVEI